ncbi:MAG: saccharopine dehydrogenase, partial [Phycisphaeraceae bacterium]|nr:saccharopine dehydrogenase [Phycisphaeraceae bacterium]
LEGFMDKHHPGKNLKERVAHFLGLEPGHPVMEKLDWLGLFSNKKIGIPNAGPAVILENLLLEKWPLLENDKDMVIMQHEFEYNLAGKKHLKTATLVMEGENRQDTAMAKTVGLPMGILAKLVLLGKIPLSGVHIPVMKEVYEPVLEELTNYGVVFEEHERLLD